jgi:hypothetical protein
MSDQQQGPQVISPRIQKLQQLQDNKRSQQLKPYLLDCAFNDITRPKQHQPLTQQQTTIQKKKTTKYSPCLSHYPYFHSQTTTLRCRLFARFSSRCYPLSGGNNAPFNLSSL